MFYVKSNELIFIYIFMELTINRKYILAICQKSILEKRLMGPIEGSIVQNAILNR
jgi:hypothetical protein